MEVGRVAREAAVQTGPEEELQAAVMVLGTVVVAAEAEVTA